MTETPETPTQGGSVSKFRKKPVVVEAIQYLPHDNCEQVGAFMGDDVDGEGCTETENDEYAVDTLHGRVWASPGDWIVCGPSGDYWPVKPDIFEQTYEPIEEADRG